MNVPEGWREVRLSEVSIRITKGTTPSNVGHSFTERGVNFIKIESIDDSGVILRNKLSKISLETHNSLSRSILKSGDILFSIAGALGKATIIDQSILPANTNQALSIIRLNHEVHVEYIALFLKSSRIQNIILGIKTTGAQSNINLEQVGNLPILLPPLLEQRQIAAFLSTWDDSLSTLARLMDANWQQKRALAEQLLTGKRRLKGFEGEWQTVRLGDVFIRVTRKNTEGNDHALTISGIHGLIDQREFFNKRVAANDLSGYYLLRHGEFAYNKSYSTGYDYGAIKRLNRYDAGVVSTLYICFALKREDAVSDFYEHFFEANLLNEGIAGIAQEGARNHGLLNVSVVDFFELPIIFPPASEQRAIAAVLTTLDTEIAALEALKAKVAEQKRGLMDALLTGQVRVKCEETS